MSKREKEMKDLTDQFEQLTLKHNTRETEYQKIVDERDSLRVKNEIF